MRILALLFALSLFLLLNPTHSASNPIRLPTADVAAVKSDTPVLDTDGDEVKAGEAYIISSIYWGAGAGEVTVEKLDSSNKCPTDVLSTTLELGSPVRITPADASATVVLPSTYQSFEFSVPIIKLCVSSLFWRVGLYPITRQFVLKLGELVPDQSDRFKIEAAELSLPYAYKISYCPFGTDKCYNVGRSNDPLTGAKRLVLNNVEDIPPFVVYFKKA